MQLLFAKYCVNGITSILLFGKPNYVIDLIFRRTVNFRLFISNDTLFKSYLKKLLVRNYMFFIANSNILHQNKTFSIMQNIL